MKNEVTNEHILSAVGKMHIKIEHMDGKIDQLEKTMHTGFARVDEQFAHVQKKFDRVDEQFEDLALMTKVQFDEIDRKLSILGARSRGFGLWQ